MTTSLQRGKPRKAGLLGRLISERDEFRRAIGVTRIAMRGLISSGIPRMAAALSYRTIFSLIPVLVVGVAVVGSFMSEAQLQSVVAELLDRAGLSEIAVGTDAAFDPPRESWREARESGWGAVKPGFETDPMPRELAVGASGDQAGPGNGGRLDEWITDLVQRVRTIRLEAIGLIGLVLLIWAAISMLLELEGTFDQVCGGEGRRRRSWARRVTTYWTVLTLGVVLLLATFQGGQEAGAWVTGMVSRVSGPAWVGPVVERTINLLINAGLLLLAYMTIPNTAIRFRGALAGAIVAGTLWEAAKGGFTAYLSGGGLERLYGQLALLPLFLLWVYMTWMIVLLGLQIAYALQHFDVWVERFDAAKNRRAVVAVDPAALLVVAGAVARQFRTGTAATLDAVSTAAGVDAGITAEMLERLVEADLIRRVQDDGEDPTFVLARPAESIPASRLLGIAESMTSTGTGEDPAGVMARLAAARRDQLAGLTLADLCEATSPETGDVVAVRAAVSGAP